MDQAAKKMGRSCAHSSYVFQSDAINFLARFGKLEIAGNDKEGWCVKVDLDSGVWNYSDCHVCAGGYTLTEALCGAVHAIDVPSCEDQP
jgi:hypothetical protein